MPFSPDCHRVTRNTGDNEHQARHASLCSEPQDRLEFYWPFVYLPVPLWVLVRLSGCARIEPTVCWLKWRCLRCRPRGRCQRCRMVTMLNVRANIDSNASRVGGLFCSFSYPIPPPQPASRLHTILCVFFSLLPVIGIPPR